MAIEYVTEKRLIFNERVAADVAGWYEMNVLMHAKKCEVYMDGFHRLWKFYHEDGEHTATYDQTFKKWI